MAVKDLKLKSRKLSVADMRSLFGENYKFLVYYNFDRRQWNFANVNRTQRQQYTAFANDAHRAISADPMFNDYELVAITGMSVNPSDCMAATGYHLMRRDVRAVPGDRAIGCSLVLRRKATNDFYAMNMVGRVLREYGIVAPSSQRVIGGVCTFASCVAWDGGVRRLVSPHLCNMR